MEDKQLTSNFAIVIGLLVLFAVVIFFIAQWLTSSDGADPNDPIVQEVIEQRIAPVGEVYVGSVPPEALAPAAPAGATAGAGFETGQDVYDAVCMACHGTGAAGAPKLGDAGAWAKYMTGSVEDAYTNAINGKGAMPPRGGRSDLSDEEVKKGVDYMFEQVQ